MLGTKSFRHQNLDLLSEKLLPPVAKHLLHLEIDQYDLALSIQHDHSIRSRFQKATKNLLTQPDLGIGILGPIRIHSNMVPPVDIHDSRRRHRGGESDQRMACVG